MTITVYKDGNRRGEQTNDGPVRWYVDDVYVGDTADGQGCEVVEVCGFSWVDEGRGEE